MDIPFEEWLRLCVLLAIALGVAVPAFAAGDAAQGKSVFAEECGDCHSPLPGKDGKARP